ncbi:MAG: hypothetical protein CR982_02625 [Candidatus Cloacimonadota bacterium]|nr:MAG: hypothetical protein CR982_02625 [Candidatus Cloacimonadota bacterium]PIE79324.1 MAG: hypothetical protein CSA15_03480 [Candidatus Delongbacteria bacterium]
MISWRLVLKRLLTTLAVAIIFTVGVQSCKSTEGVKKVDSKKEVVKKKGLTEEEIYEVRKSLSFGYNKVKTKNYRDALNYYEKAFKLDPSREHIKDVHILKIAESYEGLNIQDSARANYEAYLILNPTNKKTLNKLEYYYADANEYDKAIELMDKLLEKDPNNPSYMLKKGNYYMKIVAPIIEEEGEDSEDVKKYEEKALENFEKYQELSGDETYADLITSLTSKYRSTADLKVKFEETLKRDPKNYGVMLRLAKIYLDENNEKKAANLFEKVLKAQPDNKRAIKSLLKIYKNDVNKSMELNKRATKVDPKNEIYNINLSRLYLKKKDYVKARAELVKARNKNSSNKKIYKFWANIYQQCVSNNAKTIKYGDKLVLAISYGLLNKGGFNRDANRMAANEQVPTNEDYFINKSVTKPNKKYYSWINPNWEEFKFIEEYLKRFK